MAYRDTPQCASQSGVIQISADFVILDCKVDFEVPIIFKRPVLATGKTLVDMKKGQMKFRCFVVLAYMDFIVIIEACGLLDIGFSG